jgi:hypothetical protein
MGNALKKGSVCILEADNFLGPYSIKKPAYYPLDMEAGDFDLVVAPDGKAYNYFERVHSELICADLTTNYSEVSGYYSTHLTRRCPPFVREAPAHFTRQGKHYLITSGTTSYYPNPSEIAVGDTYHGPFVNLGVLHPKDTSKTSYHSQISSVFKVKSKKDLYIAIADRWLPNKMDKQYEDYAQYYESLFNPELTTIENIKWDERENTSKSTYVWLPIIFKGEKPEIEWRNQWSLDEFE